MKLAVFTTHPIQYQVPVFQELVRQGIDLDVVYASDHSVRGGYDKGFAREVKWDIPLLDGYRSRFLENLGGGPDKGGFRAYHCPDVKKTITELSPDAVLIPGYNTWYYLQVILAAGKLGIPLYLRGNNKDGTGPARTGFKVKLRSVVLKCLYRRFRGFFAIGEYMTQHYLHHGVPKKKITLTPYCNNSPLFEAQALNKSKVRNDMRKELGIPPEACVVMTSGRFISWKRVDLVAKAVAELDIGTTPVWLLSLGDGPKFEEWSEGCAHLLPGRFLSPGFINQSELGRFFSCGDVFVLPSDHHHETWGLVVNEAMMFGLPVVVSDGVGCRQDLVESRDTGYIFPAGDVKALTSCLQKLVSNPDLREKMGRRARELISTYSVAGNALAIRETLDRDLKGKNV